MMQMGVSPHRSRSPRSSTRRTSQSHQGEGLGKEWEFLKGTTLRYQPDAQKVLQTLGIPHPPPQQAPTAGEEKGEQPRTSTENVSGTEGKGEQPRTLTEKVSVIKYE